MARACLVEIRPLHLDSGERVSVYVTNASDRRVTGLGGKVWEPALVKAPSLGITLWNGDFTLPVDSGNAQLLLNLEVLKESYSFADRCMWIGAAVTIYAEKSGTAWPWAVRFKGRVKEIVGDGVHLTLTAQVDVEPFAKNVLTAAYKGTGVSEGGDDLKNQVKPLVLGWAKSVEPVLINATDNVYQFSGYGPIEEVTVLYERASAFSSSVGNFSNYSLLVAANIPSGRYGTCLAEGLIRLGAPAYGVITGDIKGHAINGVTPRLTGAVIAALAIIAGVDEENLDGISLDAMDVALPYPINLVLEQQTSFIDMARPLAMCCNYQSGISLKGKFFATEVTFDGPELLKFETRGRLKPQVKETSEETVSLPYWKTTFGAARAWRVHSADEIAFYSELIEKGLYNPATVYREGNIVSLENGARYLYINATPSAGNTPPNGTYWGQLSGAVGDASNLIFRKATTKPSTPSPSSTVPSGWFDDIGSVGGADQPVWACFGSKASGAANYTWDTPYAVSADKRLFDAVDGNGAVKDNQVATPAIQGGAIAVPATVSGIDTFVSAGATVDVLTTGVITVGDAVFGSAFIMVFGEVDSGTTPDVGARLNIQIDTGGGFTTVGTCAAGARTNSGDTYLKAAILGSATVSGVQNIRVKIQVTSIAMPSSSARAFTLRSPQIVVLGNKR